jgi:hypothetical protein
MNNLVIDLTHGGVKIAISLAKKGKNVLAYDLYNTLKSIDAKMLAIGDLVQPETTVTVYDYIRSNLTQQKQQIYMSNAATTLAKELHTAENVDMKKTGAALDKLLDWGN